MNEVFAWLDDGRPKRKSKFINHLLDMGQEFVGTYVEMRTAENSYGRTVHCVFYDGKEESIFDTKNKEHLAKFDGLPSGSKVKIKKLSEDGCMRYEVMPLGINYENSL